MKKKKYLNYDHDLKRIFNSSKEFSFNRDNRNKGPIYLKKFLKSKNIIISNKVSSNTAVHFFAKGNLLKKKNYLIHNEIENVIEGNTYKNMKKNFDKIFTTLDDFVDNKKFFKIFDPNFFPKIKKKPFFNNKRKLLCCISGNKYTKTKQRGDLYIKRYEDIKWFEKKIIDDFDLYGVGWQSFRRNNNFFNKVIFKFLNRLLPHNSNLINKSNRGKIKKKNILYNYKFSICYENSSSYNGYITEKIFDAFFYGNIPIYLGAPNITKYIPSNCFIDRRRFKDQKSLHNYLVTMNDDRIFQYKKNILKFLKSNKAKSFSPQNFAKLIYKNI